MSWLKGMFGNSSSTSTSSTSTNGTYGVVGPTTSTVPNSGYFGGGGGIGQISTPATGYPYITTGTGGFSNYGTIHINGTNPTLSTDKVKIDLNELGELISTLKERLLIITPNFEKMEKYQALKKAYDHYKLIESMLGDENDNKS
jgi:hypothetical protein